VGVANCVERLALGGGEFVGRVVLAAGLHEDEWAVVGDEVVFEKFGRRFEPLAKQAPETFAGNFAARACQAFDGTFGVFPFWVGDDAVDR